MKHSKLIINKCRIIFFDLEFYVPESSRTDNGFCYNPWDENCKLIGGSFLLANPAKDFGISEHDIQSKTQSHWLWQHGTEEQLLQAIYDTLKIAYDVVRKAHKGTVSPILCGIGITSSDIPILFELFKRFNILSNREAFQFQNGFRAIDLSQISVATFNNQSNFLYPKSKSHILNKYLPSTRFESGKSVWELYESGNYKDIQARVMAEVLSTHRCYELINSDIEKFKSLERREKEAVKKRDKMEINKSIEIQTYDC